MNNHFNQKSQFSQGDFGILPVYKQRGETLSALLDRIKDERSIGPVTPITYAGRLDPMADGLVLLLVGEKCKEKDKYLGLSKSYTFTVLFGIATDTEDVLGKITTISIPDVVSKKQIEETVEIMKKKTIWEYPAFSSKPVSGKPLFQHAREGNDVPVQTYEGVIEKINIVSLEKVPFQNVYQEIRSDIQKVHGDFRQDEILKTWEQLRDTDADIFLCTFAVDVSSGMYVRGMAKEMGKLMNVPTLAYRITRTRIGELVLTK